MPEPAPVIKATLFANSIDPRFLEDKFHRKDAEDAKKSDAPLRPLRLCGRKIDF
jgi:hypothetical protein